MAASSPSGPDDAPEQADGTGSGAVGAGRLALSHPQVAWICRTLRLPLPEPVAGSDATALVDPAADAVARDGLIARGLVSSDGVVDAALASVIGRAAEPQVGVALAVDNGVVVRWACGPRLAVEMHRVADDVVAVEPLRTAELLVGLARAAGLAAPPAPDADRRVEVEICWRPDAVRTVQARTGWRETGGRRIAADGTERDAASILADVRDALPGGAAAR